METFGHTKNRSDFGLCILPKPIITIISSFVVFFVFQRSKSQLLPTPRKMCYFFERGKCASGGLTVKGRIKSRHGESAKQLA